MEETAQVARGRPRIAIPIDAIVGLLNSRMSYKQIAAIYQVGCSAIVLRLSIKDLRQQAP